MCKSRLPEEEEWLGEAAAMLMIIRRRKAMHRGLFGN
jgi:hypothetical protein